MTDCTLDAQVERLKLENGDLKKALSGSSVSWSLPFDDLEVGDQMGGGGFSLVYRGYWKGTPVAIKKWFNPDHTDEVLQDFREEVMTHEALRHPNVVQFLGACMKSPNLCLVMEHMSHSLHGLIYDAKVDLDRKRILQLAMDMVRAFMYLHSRRPAVVHRDVKPANFLVDRAWRVKICDFGLAANNPRNVGAGTPQYMAPELFEHGPYNEKVDVFAFGVVLNEMDTKRVPWLGFPISDIKAKVMAGGRPEMNLSCPKPLSDLIKACWAQNMADRPSFEKIGAMIKDVSEQLFGGN